MRRVERCGLLWTWLFVMRERMPGFFRALEAEIGASQDQEWCNAPWRQGLQQQECRKQDEELVEQGAARDPGDDRISRAAGRPVTYFGVTAASSITTPADLLPALTACAAISSS